MTVKRIYSLILALLLISIQPYSAVASSGLNSSDTGTVGDADSFYTASGSVDGHVGFTAFLSASGIYLSADLDTFVDVQASLDHLYDDFKQDVAGVAQSLGELGGSIVRGGLAFSRKSWNGYKKFADWLKTKFGLTDNSNDISLSSNNLGNLLTGSKIINVGYGYIENNLGGDSFKFIGLDTRYQDLQILLYYRQRSAGSYYLGIYNGSSIDLQSGVPALKIFSNATGTGVSYYVYPSTAVRPGQVGNLNVYISRNLNTALPILSYNDSFNPDTSDDNGLSVSTGQISIPDEIPDNQEGGGNLGGLIIPAVGAGLGGAAGAIAGNIMQGVLDGAMPDIDIRPADVKVPPGMEIDDDGNVFPSDVEFRPTDVFLDSDAYKLDMLTNYFPFSIPWDMLHFAALFRAEPEIPIIDFTLPMPDGIQDIVIRVDLTPFDTVATLFRSGLYVLFCIRWLMFIYRKFG